MRAAATLLTAAVAFAVEVDVTVDGAAGDAPEKTHGADQDDPVSRLLDTFPIFNAGADTTELLRRVAETSGFSDMDLARRRLRGGGSLLHEEAQLAAITEQLGLLVSRESTHAARLSALEELARTLHLPESASTEGLLESLARLLLRGSKW